MLKADIEVEWNGCSTNDDIKVAPKLTSKLYREQLGIILAVASKLTSKSCT
jgi:hypothetical protein